MFYFNGEELRGKIKQALSGTDVRTAQSDSAN